MESNERLELRSITEVASADGNVDVYLVDHGDYARLGLWFVNHRTKFSTFLEYIPQDTRGAIGAVLPVVNETSLRWAHRGIVTITKKFDPGTASHASTYLLTISPNKYYTYHSWLLQEWIPLNQTFGILRTGSTPKKFLEQSISYLAGTQGIKALLPKVVTYDLQYDSKSYVTSKDDEASFFFASLTDIETIYEYADIVSTLGVIYLPDRIDGTPSYWKYIHPRLVPCYERINTFLDVREEVSATADPVPPPANAGCCEVPPPSCQPEKTSLLSILFLVFLLVIAMIVIVAIVYFVLNRPQPPTPVVGPAPPMVTSVYT